MPTKKIELRTLQFHQLFILILSCLVNIPRNSLCNNTLAGVIHDPSLTFWSYLVVRTVLGVLTAASLMMFEGAVMATVQEMGGDYGIQRFVGNFGAIVFAPLGGFIIDATSGSPESEVRPVVVEKSTYSAVIYVYLALKLVAAVMILMIQLDFKPPGERILSNIRAIVKNLEVVVFLTMMMFAGEREMISGFNLENTCTGDFTRIFKIPKKSKMCLAGNFYIIMGIIFFQIDNNQTLVQLIF